MRGFIAFLVLLVFIPISAYAGVVINEVAWMGTADSSTNEWIELYNEGDASIDLSGWTLSATDGSPSIALSGVIGPRAYYLIERTDDQTVPTIPADLVTPFGKGLGNTGETLQVKDHTGAVVDSVAGGSDWANIGGDNATKETAQRKSSEWMTGVATPRASNGDVSLPQPVAPQAPPPESTPTPAAIPQPITQPPVSPTTEALVVAPVYVPSPQQSILTSTEVVVVQAPQAASDVPPQPKKQTTTKKNPASRVQSDQKVLAAAVSAALPTSTNIVFGEVEESAPPSRVFDWGIFVTLSALALGVGVAYIWKGKDDVPSLTPEDFTIIEEEIDEDGNVKQKQL